MRSFLPRARAARSIVCSVTEGLDESSRRSSADRLVRMRLAIADLDSLFGDALHGCRLRFAEKALLCEELVEVAAHMSFHRASRIIVSLDRAKIRISGSACSAGSRRHRLETGDPGSAAPALLWTLQQPGGDRQSPGFRMLHFKNPVRSHYMSRTLRTSACAGPVHMAPQQGVGFPPTREYDLHEIPQEPGVAPDCLFAKGRREGDRHVGLNDVVLRTDQLERRLAEGRFPQEPFLSGGPSPGGRLEGPTTFLEMRLNPGSADTQAGCGGGIPGGGVLDHFGLSGSRSGPGSAAGASHDYRQGEVSQGCHRRILQSGRVREGHSSGGSGEFRLLSSRSGLSLPERYGPGGRIR